MAAESSWMSAMGGPSATASSSSSSASAALTAATDPSSFAPSFGSTPFIAKKKRGRFSDEKSVSDLFDGPSIVQPSSPELVPRHSSSASSWGVAEESESDGDYEWSHYHLANNNASLPSHSIPVGLQSPDPHLDDLAAFSRPSKRAHVETPEDRHTYGKFASMQIDPASFSSSLPTSRSTIGRSNSGLAAAFGLSSSSTSSAFPSFPPSLSTAPSAPPSSPTKASGQSFDLAAGGSTPSAFYQQAVAPAPPTSPTLANRQVSGSATPTSSFWTHTATIPSKRSNSVDLEDTDMRQRKAPTSYEVEPDRIVVTSLDDTSSSEDGGASDVDADDDKTPEADTSTESNKSDGEYIINNELIEKLEAHRRAVITGTSDRDNASSRASNGNSRSRRSGRRSGGTNGGPSLGSLLSSKRRSNQSSQASSGYASPINAEEAKGALVLWKDPEEVLRATATSAPATSSPFKPVDSSPTPTPSSTPNGGDFMSQPPVAFHSAGADATRQSGRQSHLDPSRDEGNGFCFDSPIHGMDSPLYAQQSSLSSSYFPSASTLETRYGSTGSASHGFGSMPDHATSDTSARPVPRNWNLFGQASTTPAPDPSHQHVTGAQPIDLSSHFGPAEQMDLDG